MLRCGGEFVKSAVDEDLFSENEEDVDERDGPRLIVYQARSWRMEKIDCFNS